MESLRFTLRKLRKSPGFTIVGVLTLGLCIGANVVIFAVVDSVLMRPLPFREPDRLVTTINSYPKAGVPRSSSSLPNYYDRRTAIGAFETTAAIRADTVIVGEPGSPQRVAIERVTPEFFETLGVVPAAGRFFSEEELDISRSGVVVLRDAYWRAHFNADPDVIGRSLRVNGVSCEVIGVLPRDFRYLSSRAELFFPLASSPDDRGVKRRHSNNLQVIARLRQGATLADAQKQMDALNAQQIVDDPFSGLLKDAGYHTIVAGLRADHVRQIRPVLILLEAGVLTLFVIGGVNLVNLLLVRSSGRSKEFAVRQALGAGRRHVIREVLLETTVLSLSGAILGLLLGGIGIRVLPSLGIERLPLGTEVHLDGRVVLTTLAGALIAGMALALPVIWLNIRSRLAMVLQTESRGGTASRAAQRVRHGLIIGQVALAFVLLSGAGLLGLSLTRVLEVSPGFQPDHILTGQLTLPGSKYPNETARLSFIRQLLEELRGQPGVKFAGINTTLPLSGDSDDNATSVEGYVRAPGESIQTHYTSGVVGDYWKAIGIPLIEGRYLEPADHETGRRVCVVDQDFARRYWPNRSALGRRIANDPEFKEEEAFEIVGVVGRVKQKELGDPTSRGAVYYPYRYYPPSSFYLVLRTVMPPEQFANTLRKLVLRLNPELPVDDLHPMVSRIENSLTLRRLPALLAGAFAIGALLLASIGTYGVLAYAVSQRRREIGVRMALGAMPSQIRKQFLAAGSRLLVFGVVLGSVGAWASGQAMRGVLFEVGAIHPGILFGAAGVMMIVVLLASCLPSELAARVSPTEALREK